AAPDDAPGVVPQRQHDPLSLAGCVAARPDRRAGERVLRGRGRRSMICYHFVSNPCVVFALKLGAVFIFFLTAPLVLGYVEHKGLAHMQARLGPMEAGKFHGWAQLIADGVKFIQQEDIVPDAADRRICMLAPMLVILP